MVVVHAGGETVFVSDALLIFKLGSKKGDYHNEMNYEYYGEWITEILMPNLNKNSVIVIDNGPYQISQPPTSLTRKAEMIICLVNHAIPCIHLR